MDYENTTSESYTTILKDSKAELQLEDFVFNECISLTSWMKGMSLHEYNIMSD